MSDPSPTSARLPLALIAWAAASIALNVGMHRFTYGVMLPALRRDLDLDYLASGVLNAVHLAAYLAGTLIAPRLVRRFGVASLSKYGHGLVAIGALVCAIAPADPALGPLVLGAGRVMTGLGGGWAILSVLVIALGAVSAERRPFVSAVVWAGMGAAIIGSGLAIGGLLGPSIGWRLAFVATAALALALAVFFPPVDMSEPAAEAAGPAPPFRIGAVLTRRWGFLVTAYLLFGTGYIAYATFAGARMAAANAPVWVAGAMWVAIGVASAVGAALTVVILRDARLKPWALAIGLGLATAGTALSALASTPATIAGALLVGLGMASTPSIVSAQARERSSAADYASAFSVATAALGTGQLVGPVIAGGLSDAFGTIAAPLVATLAYGIATVAALADRQSIRHG